MGTCVLLGEIPFCGILRGVGAAPPGHIFRRRHNGRSVLVPKRGARGEAHRALSGTTVYRQLSDSDVRVQWRHLQLVRAGVSVAEVPRGHEHAVNHCSNQAKAWRNWLGARYAVLAARAVSIRPTG